MFILFLFFGLIYYLVFWILVLTFYFLFIFYAWTIVQNCLLVQFCPLVHFWPVPSKVQNPCKIDPSCKIDPRAKMTLRAKVTPCKIVCSSSFVPSCKSVFVQKWSFVQFYLRTVLCPRARMTPCNFILHFCALASFVPSCIFDCEELGYKFCNCWV